MAVGYMPKPKSQGSQGPGPENPHTGQDRARSHSGATATTLGLRPGPRAWALDVSWGCRGKGL